MYAVIRTGGKQYRVSEGDTLQVEKLEGAVGDTIDISEVLLVGGGEQVQIGTPLVENAKVTAQIVAHGKSKKTIVFKKKRRKSYSRKIGHRQELTTLKITAINT